VSAESTIPELPVLAARVGQLIHSNELKMAGKLLATARGHLAQLAEKNSSYQHAFEHVAELRNALMEPGGPDFEERKLLAQLLEEEKELHRLVAHDHAEPLLVAHTCLKAAAAIVLVYAQEATNEAPLDLEGT
jgi:hypothetical protein